LHCDGVFGFLHQWLNEEGRLAWLEGEHWDGAALHLMEEFI